LDSEALRRLDMSWEDLFRLAEQVAEQLSHAKELIYYD
jgi:hypothetical protein